MTSNRSSAFHRHLKRYTADTPRGRAALAALRRGLGKPPGTASEMYRYVEQALAPDDGPARTETAYIIASLYGLHPSPDGDAFGTAVAAIRHRESGEDDPGVERRFIALLDAGREELPDHLRHLISLVKARSEARLDYARLFDDLLDWEAPDRPVQRRWARQFWRSKSPEVTPAGGGEAGQPDPSGEGR